jgi:NMD protein affecting ribosome stability and mRNA decay
MKRREPSQRQRRHIDRAFDALKQDPYLERGKPRGPAVCPDCGAVFRRGRWQWGEASERAQPHLCAACRRVRERQPAGSVRLGGPFFAEHRDEVLALVRNQENREKRAHPLQRIIAMRETRGALEVTTTDIHIARRIGDALSSAFRGTLEVRYSPGEYRVRVSWSR